MTKLSTHFNVPQDEEQLKIFVHALRDSTIYQVEKAFERCLNECEFMPKLADVHRRMPEERYPPENPGSAKYRKPTLDLTRPIAEEICKELSGREYAEIRELCGTGDPEATRLVGEVFFQANRIRYIRMGRTGKWFKPTEKQLEIAARKLFEDWENI